jgi:hypothetical protein
MFSITERLLGSLPIPAISSLSLSVSFLICCALHGADGSLSSHDIQSDILAAWEDRQRKVTSARFELIERGLTPRGTLSQSAWAKTEDEFPPDDVITERRYTLLFSGDCMKLVQRGKFPHLNDLQFIELKETGVFSGGQLMRLSTIEGRSHPQGLIDDRNILSSSSLWRPIVWSMGGADRVVSRLRAGALRFDGRDVSINDNTTIVVLQDTAGGTEWWVRPDLDYSIVRRAARDPSTGKLRFEVNVRYTADDDVGWIPDGWTERVYLGDELHSHADIRVAGYSINPDIPAAEFQLEFPVGTIVWDNTTSTRYRQLVGGARGSVEETTESESKEMSASRLTVSGTFAVASVIAAILAVVVLGWCQR